MYGEYNAPYVLIRMLWTLSQDLQRGCVPDERRNEERNKGRKDGEKVGNKGGSEKGGG